MQDNKESGKNAEQLRMRLEYRIIKNEKNYRKIKNADLPTRITSVVSGYNMNIRICNVNIHIYNMNIQISIKQSPCLMSTGKVQPSLFFKQ